MIDDMNMRRYACETQRNYVRDVARLAAYLGRPPDAATAEDLRQFQIDQREAGLGVPTMNSIVAALRFFFTHTLDRPDLSRKLYTVKHPRSLPVVLSPDEVARLLDATTSLKHQAALSVAFGAGLRVAEVAMLKLRDVDSERMLTGRLWAYAVDDRSSGATTARRWSGMSSPPIAPARIPSGS
jgi:site-specific recombinase XerD